MSDRTGNVKRKNNNTIFFIFAFALLSEACIFPVTWTNPGYEVSISVKEMKSDDLFSIENSIKIQNYTFQGKNQIPGSLCSSYSKDISTNKQIKHKNVKVTVCYDDSYDSPLLKNFEILIINEWDGQEPEIKKEIDRMADSLYGEISKFVEKEKILVEKRATGPHF